MAKEKTKGKLVEKKYLMCQNSEPDGKYWFGYECYNMVEVSESADKVLCSRCVMIMLGPPETKKKYNGTKKPRGWHFMEEFVDSDGNVYHKGVEQPKLKGTLPPTEIKKKKKKKTNKLSKQERQQIKVKIGNLKRKFKREKSKSKKAKLEKEMKKMERKLNG